MRKKLLSTLILLLSFLFASLSPATARGEDRLLPFKGMSLAGKPLDMEQVIGKRPVMLIFWASWCPSCRVEVPKINKLAEKYQGRGMDFIAINVGHNDSVERAQAFANKNGMTYPILFDSSSQITDQYRVQGVPTVIIADKRGIIRFRNFGAPDISEADFTELLAD